ncbi:MAG: APC family permease [Thermoleophilaceae bacterium]|nr:APC family permease [Thermoleophilaceae bacterium]
MESAAGRVEPLGEPSLFARKATGLVRGWAVRDAFIYAFFSINLVTLGFFIFSYAVFIPGGSLFWAVLLSGAYLLLQAVTYASLVAAMPRAGGDYVWISRILGGGLGFVLAVCGWWFILWHWVPIYANILNVEVFVPLFAIVGWDGGVTFFSEDRGLFWSSVIVAGLASLFIALGIRTYARIQQVCFYGALLGLAFMFVLLLVNSKTDFISALNTQSQEVLGTGPNAYQGTIDAAAAGTPSGVGDFGALSGIFLLIPFIVFFNLWSNWGATLYGEVRGASDFRKNIRAMGGALVVTTILAGISFLLFAKTFGWDFYNAANNGYWGQPALFDYVEDPAITFFPYPGLLAAFLMDGAVWQFILVALMALWFFGWVGTVFLSSTRVVFATAFDRVLPETVAKVSRRGVPYVALALMLIPALPISWLYAFNEDFYSWTLAATMVIAITFAGSAIAAAVLPWRKPEIYNASPIGRYRVAGIPLITVTAIGFLALLVFCLYKWLQDDVYGLNDSSSLIYMGVLYVIALVIYIGSRIVRRRQGIDMAMVHKEIPAE